MSDLPPDPVGDRGVSPVAAPLTPRRLGRWASLIGLATALVLIGLASLPSRRAPPPPAPARQVVAFEPARPTLDNPGPNPPKLSAAPAAASDEASRSAASDAARTAPPGSGDATAPPSAAAAQAAQARADLRAIRAAPMIAFARGQPASTAPRA
ncbi:hypothetical protein MQH10_24435, partial [Phenylobacterium aquaticum]|nr:hypothetical protein [Phenylobacterium aquaticum]